jgi:hypothetical protein
MNHKQRTIQMLERGWLTALASAQMGGCLSLSQRVGELKRSGVTVIDKWVTTNDGARVKAYRIVNRKKLTA